MPGTEAYLNLDDQSLVASARTGDNDAFGELIRRHWHKCVDLATCFLRNRSDAEDEAQNAFAKAYAHLDQYQGQAEFSTWLARIVTNQCFMLMRARRRTRFIYLDETLNDRSRPLELASGAPDPEGEFAFHQTKCILRTEIRRIPPMLRNVILLRDIQELPMGDVAEQLGITVPAAKSRLLRARTELRSRIMRHAERSGKLPQMSRSGAPHIRLSQHRAVRSRLAATA